MRSGREKSQVYNLPRATIIVDVKLNGFREQMGFVYGARVISRSPWKSIKLSRSQLQRSTDLITGQEEFLFL